MKDYAIKSNTNSRICNLDFTNIYTHAYSQDLFAQCYIESPMEKIHGGEKKVAIKYPAMEVSGLALKYGFFEFNR